MRIQNLLIIISFAISILLLGCGGDSPSQTNDNNGQNSNSDAQTDSESKTRDPLGTVKTPQQAAEVKVAETLKPVVDAYCTAINNGDDESLKKVFSAAAWKSLSADARAEGKTSVAKYLSASEPIGDKCQVINERIVGETAEATIITKTYPNGVPLKFVKENGGWKWTNQSSDFEAVRKKTN